ncbi:hypothetical protein LguiB_028698 [Lonicera macranthoides]
MEELSKQALVHVANLTLPSFQVVVISANLGCAYCRSRVSQLVTKVTGLKEYTLDVRNRQVTVKGDVRIPGFAINTLKNNKSKKYSLKLFNDFFRRWLYYFEKIYIFITAVVKVT